MADGRQEAAWNHTADLLCLLANIHRDRESRPDPFGRSDFHPYAEGADQNATDVDFDDCSIDVLKVFLP